MHRIEEAAVARSFFSAAMLVTPEVTTEGCAKKAQVEIRIASRQRSTTTTTTTTTRKGKWSRLMAMLLLTAVGLYLVALWIMDTRVDKTSSHSIGGSCGHGAKEKICRMSDRSVATNEMQIERDGEDGEADNQREWDRRFAPFFPMIRFFAVAQQQFSPLYFTLTNANQPTLGQLLRMQIRGWDFELAGDPRFESGSTFFFVPNSTSTCDGTLSSSVPGNNFTVTADAAGYTATSDVVIKTTVFAISSSYSVCYVQGGAAYIVRFARVELGELVPIPFTVLDRIYRSHSLLPQVVFAGQGPITLTLSENDQTAQGRLFNQGGMSRRPFLIPCLSTSSSGVVDGSNTDCSNTDALVAMCPQGSTAADAIVVRSVSGYQTATQAAPFVAPLAAAAAAASYLVCVPFCFSNGACTDTSGSAFTLSWTLVIDAAITFQPINPAIYNATPTNVQARDAGILSFSGSALAAGDRVMILANGQQCADTNPTVLANILYVESTIAFNAGTVSTTTFKLPTLPASAITGLICYSRFNAQLNPNSVWAPVYTSVANTNTRTSDFVILPMQPTAFTLTPSAPRLGQTFAVHFTGQGLNSSTDSAFLVYAPSITCTVTSASDPCDLGDTLTPRTVFSCGSMTGGANPQCSVTVDPIAVNSASNLCVCYRKVNSFNSALVAGTAALAARNPTYTIAPYPFYAGQAATMTVTGTGLTSTDTIKLIYSAALAAASSSSSFTTGAGSASCATAPALANVTISPTPTVVTAGTTHTYTVVGLGDVCFDVCYLSSSGEWTLSRPTNQLVSGSSACPTSSAYVLPFTMTYTLNPAAPTTFQTVDVRFAGSTQTVSTVTVVPQTEDCASLLCGANNNVAPCAVGQNANDFSLYTSSNQALIQVKTARAYIICVSTGTGAAGSPIPVPSAAAGTRALFGRTDAPIYATIFFSRNPSMMTLFPTVWRINMQLLTLTFTGAYVSNVSDIVRIVSASALLSPTMNVCPTDGAFTQTVLASSASLTAPDPNPNTTTFNIRGSETITDATSTVHVCYFYYATPGSTAVRTAVYMGAITLQPSNPASLNFVSGRRAGLLAVLQFPAAATGGATLNPASDRVFFYRYIGSATSNCRCDPSAAGCSPADLITSSIALTGTSSLSTWRDALGFTNYGTDVNYTVCYNVSSAGVPTFLNEIRVTRANPTYFSVSSLDGNVNSPYLITVTTVCTTCAPLTALDTIIMIPSTAECSLATGLNASLVETVGAVEVITSTQVRRRLVPLAQGQYRVCYRINGEATFTDLVDFTSYQTDNNGRTRNNLNVRAADPLAFIPFPTAPTAGQYITLNMSVCGTLCDSCNAVRLLNGAGASCWVTNVANISTSRCSASSRIIDFQNIFIVAGAYTVCYGSDYLTSRRLPAPLVVLPANPSNYRAVGGDYSVFTNQATPMVMEFNGTNLGVNDQVFLIPFYSGFHCHDLRSTSFELISNITENANWLPSTLPYPLTISPGAVNNNSVRWTVSDTSKRFSSDILTSYYCSEPGVRCRLQVCYKRFGTSWAEVPSATGQNVFLYPANPRTLVLDVVTPQFRVNQYTLATVTGTDLGPNDDFYFSDGVCEAAVFVGKKISIAVTDTGATRNRFLVRFVGRNNPNAARACYVRGSTTTEILVSALTSALIVSTEIRYMKNFTAPVAGIVPPPVPHIYTQYELVNISATISPTGATTLTNSDRLNIVAGASECTYAAFAALQTWPIISIMSRTSPVVAPSYFAGRALQSGNMSFCLYTTGGQVYRITTPINSDSQGNLTIAPANPIVYTTAPASSTGFLMANQSAVIRFSASNFPVVDYSVIEAGASSELLDARDFFEIVRGSLYDCGAKNLSDDSTNLLGRYNMAEAVANAANSSDLNATARTASLRIVVPFSSPTLVTNGVREGFTVCYYKYNAGLAATVPNGTTATPDKNLVVAPLYPKVYTVDPTPTFDEDIVTLRFFSEGLGNLFSTDNAKLVYVDTIDGSLTGGRLVPLPSDCTNETAVATNMSTTNVTVALDGSPASGSTSATATSRWTFTARAVGRFAVCYKRSGSGGEWAYVPSPGLLEIRPRASPYNFRVNAGTGQSVPSGSRFFLNFDSVLPLTPKYESDPTADATKDDLVRISTTSNCLSPLTSSQVQPIPSSFGFLSPPPTAGVGGAVNLRMRTTGTFFVCFKRWNVTIPTEPYFDWTPIGVAPSFRQLTVTSPIIASFTVSGTAAPRVRIPKIRITPTFSAGYTAANVKDLFVVKYNDSVATDQAANDYCFRPTAQLANLSLVPPPDLLDTSYNITTSAAADGSYAQFEMKIPFTESGRWVLCLTLNTTSALQSGLGASSHPTPIIVSEPLPGYYTLPASANVIPGAQWDLSLVAENGVLGLLTPTAFGSIHVFDPRTTEMTQIAPIPVPYPTTTAHRAFVDMANTYYSSVESNNDGYYYENDVEGMPHVDAVAVRPSVASLFFSQATSTFFAYYAPSCRNQSKDLAPGTAITSVFSGTDAIATMTTRIQSNGTFYVCYRPFDQTNAAAVPRDSSDGSQGFVFSIGIDGPSQYTIHQQSPTLTTATRGEELNITILGEGLSDVDMAKIVDVSSTPTSQTTFFSECSNSAISINGLEGNVPSTAGLRVEDPSAAYNISNGGRRVYLHAVVNKTVSRAVVCYQLNGTTGWVWISSPPTFAVIAPNPAYYTVAHLPAYTTQKISIDVTGSSGSLAPPSGGGGNLLSLGASDQFKLVPKGAGGTHGFDCLSVVAESSSVSASRRDAVSTSAAAIRVCSTELNALASDPFAVARWTVCYKVGTIFGWSEIPFAPSSAATPYYSSLVVRPLPFGAPQLSFTPPRLNQPIFVNFSQPSSQTPAYVPSDTFINSQIWFASQNVVAQLLCNLSQIGYSPLINPVESMIRPSLYPNDVLVTIGKTATVVPLVNLYGGRNPPGNLPTMVEPSGAVFLLNSPITIGPCDPCTYGPIFAYPASTRRLVFDGLQLDNTRDLLRIIPARFGALGCANINFTSSTSPTQLAFSSGAFADTVYSPVVSESSATQTIFIVPVPTTAAVTSVVGDYVMCYRKGNLPSTAGFVAVTNTSVPSPQDTSSNSSTSGHPQLFSVIPTAPLLSSICPDVTLYGGQRFTLNFSKSGTSSAALGKITALDRLYIIPTSSLLGDRLICPSTVANASSSNPLLFAAGLPADSNNATWAQFDLVFPPSLATQQSFTFCYSSADRDESLAGFRAVGTTVVMPANPSGLSSIPTIPTINTTGIRLVISGTALTAADQLFVIDAADPASTCAETCRNPIASVPQYPNAPIGLSYVLDTSGVPSTVQVVFTMPFPTRAVLGVCYRLGGGYNLARLPQTVTIGPLNPYAYTVSFTPRVGTRPVITFLGTSSLTTRDTAWLVPSDTECSGNGAGPVVAVGEFIRANDTVSQFYFALNRTIANSYYRVCYQIFDQLWIEVAPKLLVLPNPITAFITSNTPMAGRATEITFPQFSAYFNNASMSSASTSALDGAKVVCGTCSCYEGDPQNGGGQGQREVIPIAFIQYGSNVSQVPVANISVGPLIRIGLNEISYKVCYKLADSGYAPVNDVDPATGLPSTSPVFTPIIAYPRLATMAPTTAYKGERLRFTLTSDPSASLPLSPPRVPLTPNDGFMITTKRRGCWERPTVDPSEVINFYPTATDPTVRRDPVTGYANVNVSSDQLMAYVNAHIPSLGPNMSSYSAFPQDIVVCVREAGQLEFVFVGFVSYPTRPAFNILPPSVSGFVLSVPNTPINGWVNTTLTFVGDVGPNDMAYAIVGPYSNRICDTPSNEVLSSVRSAYPQFIFTPSTLSSDPVTFCIIKANGGTVAEVPQQMPLTAGNPAQWLNPSAPDFQRLREYLTIAVVGNTLSSIDDSLVMSAVPCEQWPITPAPTIGKITPLAYVPPANSPAPQYPSAVSFTLQYLPPSDSATSAVLYMCYRHAASNQWYQVPARQMKFEVASPRLFMLLDSNALTTGQQATTTTRTAVRQGQSFVFRLAEVNSTIGNLTAGRAVFADGYQWCNNASTPTGAEPYLRTWVNTTTRPISSPPTVLTEVISSIYVPYWVNTGVFSICSQLTTRPWSDSFSTAAAPSRFVVGPPNPTLMTPSVTRAGQQIRISFNLAAPWTIDDRVKIVSENSYVSCADASPMSGHGIISPLSVSNFESYVEPRDANDPTGFESFSNAGTYTVCYYSGSDGAWAAVGGTLASARLTVLPRIPLNWNVDFGSAVLRQRFSIRFNSPNEGQLDFSTDTAWAVPITAGRTCSTPLGSPACGSECLNLTLVSGTFYATVSQTQVVFDNMTYSLCYRPANSGLTRMKDLLVIAEGPIRCANIAGPLVLGARSSLTFLTQENVNTTGDSLRFSAYDPTGSAALSCGDLLEEDFVEGRAVVTGRTTASITFSFEWPLTMNASYYGICYKHQGVYMQMCGCGSGATECRITTSSPPIPTRFATSFFPIYAGQRITVLLNSTTTNAQNVVSTASIAEVKLVRDTNVASKLADCSLPALGGIISAAAQIATPYGFSYYSAQLKLPYDPSVVVGSLIVCARLTSDPINFRRVPSAELTSITSPSGVSYRQSGVAPYDNNLIPVRPYLMLSTFPSQSYWFALETLRTIFTHQSNLQDDTTSLRDGFILVRGDKNLCDESYINNNATLSTVNKNYFVVDDTDVKSWPGSPTSTNTSTRSSSSYLTFSGPQLPPPLYFCYRLAGATWAVVDGPGLVIGNPIVDQSACAYQSLTSPLNNMANINNIVPAWQYSHISSRGINNYSQLVTHYNLTLDPTREIMERTRVVPQSQLCADYVDNDVFTATPAQDPSPSTAFIGLFLAPKAGTYKLCLRIGGEGTTLFSPLCPNIAVGNPIVLATRASGCFHVGQTLLNLRLQRNPISSTVQRFHSTDRFRVILGTDNCDSLDIPSTRTFLPSISINRTLQSSASGVQVSPVDNVLSSTIGNIFFTNAMNDALTSALRDSSVKMCYTDAAGNEYAVPFVEEVTKALFPMAPRHTMVMQVTPARPQIGQLILIQYVLTPESSANVNASSSSPLGIPPSTQLFSPSVRLTVPWQEAMLPTVNTTWYDANGLLSLGLFGGDGAGGAGSTYQDGQCALTFAETPANLIRSSVVGNSPYGPTYGRAERNVTANTFKPCYQLAGGCSLADMSATVTIYAANPSVAVVDPQPPRRGQLFTTTYQRNTADPAAALLQPGLDRAAAADDCWGLDLVSGGVPVVGNSQQTTTETIVYAQDPAVAEPVTKAHACYKLNGASWAYVPPPFDILAANPAGYTTWPPAPARQTIIEVDFFGYDLRTGDVAKIVPKALNCTDSNLPSYGFYNFDSVTNQRIIATGGPNGRLGWPVAVQSLNASRLIFTTNITGTFSVCYRKVADTRWTLVYKDMVIGESSTVLTFVPASALEGELFSVFATLNSSLASVGAAVPLGPANTVTLIYGADKDCFAPSDVVAEIVGTPVRTDLLPNELVFQLAAGVRGLYTVCYRQQEFGAAGGRTVVSWGYGPVYIGDNPRSFSPLPTTPRAQQIVGLLFDGHGLMSEPSKNKTDEFKLLDPPANPGAVTIDSAYCRQTPATSDVSLVSLVAYGNQSLVTINTENALTANPANKQYIVCYKLFGGQFHPMASGRLVLNPRSPSTATFDKSFTDLGNGESLTVTMTFTSSGVRSGDYVFVSARKCADIPVVIPSSTITPPAGGPEQYFEKGTYGYVTANPSLSAFSATVRFPSATSSSSTVASTKEYSVCYRSPLDTPSGSTSIIAGSVTVGAGSPTAAVVPTTPIPAKAVFQVAFPTEVNVTTTSGATITVSFVPSLNDVYNIVSNPSDCIGTLTTGAAGLFVTPMTQISPTHVGFMTAAPSAGTYYVCYAHRVGTCDPQLFPNRNCARIVGGAITVTSADPIEWSSPTTSSSGSAADSSPTAFAFEPFAAVFQLPAVASSSLSTADFARDFAWLALVSTTTAPSVTSMLSIANACINTKTDGTSSSTDPTLRQNLTFNSVSGQFVATPSIRSQGQFAVCYQQKDDALPRIFSPANRRLTVLPAAVTSASLVTPAPAVSIPVTFAINGNGLQASDACELALGVPSSAPATIAGLPSDICSNATKYPRTACSTVGSSSGLSPQAVTRTATVSIAGRYTLCYATGSDIITTSMTPLLRPVLAPFVIGSVVTQVSVTSAAQVTNTPLTLQFNGLSLDSRDRVALVPAIFATNGGGAVIVDAATICASAPYSQVNTINSDKTVTTQTTIVTVAQQYRACYLPYYTAESAPPTLLPQVITISLRTVSSIAFARQPVCSQFDVCATQPRVAMLDANGSPAADNTAVITLRLRTTSGTNGSYVYVGDGAIVSPLQSALVDWTTFWFFDLTILLSGTFVLEARVSLSGGLSFATTSSPFYVSPGNSTFLFARSSPAIIRRPDFGIVVTGPSTTTSTTTTAATTTTSTTAATTTTPTATTSTTMTVTTTFVGTTTTTATPTQETTTTTVATVAGARYPRYYSAQDSADPSYNVTYFDCSVLSKLSFAPDSYALSATGGATFTTPMLNPNLTQTEIGEGFMKKYSFTVTPNLLDRSVNYITVSIAALGAFTNQRIDGAPLILRIATTPDTNSYQDCRSTSSTAPTATINGLAVIRSGESLACLIQGRIAVPNTSPVILQPVQSFGDSYIFFTSINDDPSTITEMPLPEFASDLNGLFSQPVVAPQASVASTFEVATVLRYVVGTPYIQRAPQKFIVVASPLSTPTVVECRSLATGSTTLFVPSEPLACTLSSSQQQRLLSNDLTVAATDGAAVTAPIPTGVVSTRFDFSVAAGPRQSFTTTATNSRVFEALATTPVGNAYFAVTASFVPLQQQVTNQTYPLIYVVAASAPNGYPANAVTAVTMVGSNLAAGNGNVYIISPTQTCNITNVDSPATTATNFIASTASPTSTVGIVGNDNPATTGLTLSFSTPSFLPFYICVRPSDATRAALLTTQSFNNGTGGAITTTAAAPPPDNNSSGLSTDDLILLIVGLCLVLLFLIILLIVCCCVRRNRAQAVTKIKVVGRGDRAAARENDQYVFNGIESGDLDVVGGGGLGEGGGGGVDTSTMYPRPPPSVSAYNQSHLSRVNNSAFMAMTMAPQRRSNIQQQRTSGNVSPSAAGGGHETPTGVRGNNTPRVHMYAETPPESGPAANEDFESVNDEENSKKLRKTNNKDRDKRPKKEKRSKKSTRNSPPADDDLQHPDDNNNVKKTKIANLAAEDLDEAEFSDIENENGAGRPQPPPPSAPRGGAGITPSSATSGSTGSNNGSTLTTSSEEKRRKKKEGKEKSAAAGTNNNKQRRDSSSKKQKKNANNGGGGGVIQGASVSGGDLAMLNPIVNPHQTIVTSHQTHFYNNTTTEEIVPAAPQTSSKPNGPPASSFQQSLPPLSTPQLQQRQQQFVSGVGVAPSPYQPQSQQSLPTGTAYNYGGSYAVRGHSSGAATSTNVANNNTNLTQQNLSNLNNNNNNNNNNFGGSNNLRQSSGTNSVARMSAGTSPSVVNGGRQAVNSAHPVLRMNAIEES